MSFQNPTVHKVLKRMPHPVVLTGQTLFPRESVFRDLTATAKLNLSGTGNIHMFLGYSGQGKTVAMQLLMNRVVKRLADDTAIAPVACHIDFRSLIAINDEPSKLATALDLLTTGIGDFATDDSKSPMFLRIKSRIDQVRDAFDEIAAQRLHTERVLVRSGSSQIVGPIADAIRDQDSEGDRVLQKPIKQFFCHPILWIDDIHTCHPQFAAFLLMALYEFPYPVILTTSDRKGYNQVVPFSGRKARLNFHEFPSIPWQEIVKTLSVGQLRWQFVPDAKPLDGKFTYELKIDKPLCSEKTALEVVNYLGDDMTAYNRVFREFRQIDVPISSDQDVAIIEACKHYVRSNALFSELLSDNKMKPETLVVCKLLFSLLTTQINDADHKFDNYLLTVDPYQLLHNNEEFKIFLDHPDDYFDAIEKLDGYNLIRKLVDQPTRIGLKRRLLLHQFKLFENDDRFARAEETLKETYRLQAEQKAKLEELKRLETLRIEESLKAQLKALDNNDASAPADPKL